MVVSWIRKSSLCLGGAILALKNTDKNHLWRGLVATYALSTSDSTGIVIPNLSRLKLVLIANYALQYSP